MAHFLPTGTLPAAPHVLASVQPWAPTAPGPEVGTQEDAWLGWHHFNATMSSLGVMLCHVTAGNNDTRYNTRTHRQTESDAQANRFISL